MEVVGVIAAVPELLKLVHDVATTASQISSGARIYKVVQGSQAQLQLLEQVLRSIQHRHEEKLLDNALSSRLAPVLRDVQIEVAHLQRLLNKISGANGASGVLKRAHLVIQGFEKQFKGHFQRIESTVNLLQLYLSESTVQFSHKSQLSKALHSPTTNFIPEKLSGTGQWLWSHETFKFWTGCRTDIVAGSSTQASSPERVTDRVLCIYGVKGSGKSVLASSVVDELRSRGDTTLFFSFWAGSDEATRSIAMLRSLLWQLLNTLPAEEQHLHIPRLLENQAELIKPVSVCRELLKLGELHGRSLYIVLDGIDESIDDWNDMRNGPLASFAELLQHNSYIRLLLVGRQSSLRSALSKWPLTIEITEQLVRDDLNRLIICELESCPNIVDSVIRELIQKELESRSSVMFLWIKLVFKQLRQSFSMFEVKKILNSPLNELNTEYSRLLSMLMTRLGGHDSSFSVGMDRARRLLTLITGASRPLTVTELQLAYAYSVTTSNTDAVDINSYIISQEAIVHSCGDFVTIQDELVYFGHASIREYLLRATDLWESGDRNVRFFRLDAKDCELQLGMTCLRYLRDIKWQGDDETRDAETLIEAHPLLHYATGYVASHILCSDPQFEQTSRLLEGLLNTDEVFRWIEFVFSVDSGESRQMAPLPLQFWDDLLHLLVAWDIFGTPKSNTTRTRTSHVTKFIAPQRQTPKQEDVRSACMDLLGLQFFNADSSEHFIQRYCDFVVEDPAKRLPLHAQKMRDVVGNLVPHEKLHGMPQLQQIVLRFNGWLTHTKILANPLDILLETLEKSLRGMSFLSLMAFGQLFEKSRPHQALKIYKMAAGKVQNETGLKAAWVLSRIGECLRCQEETRDIEEAEKYYLKCMDSLAKSQQNPLVVMWWCGAARCRVQCLLELDSLEEAKLLITEIEGRLLKTQIPLQGPSLLPQWSYPAIWNSTMMVRGRVSEMIQLGHLYQDFDLFEDLERLMMTVTEGKSFMRSVNLKARIKSIDFLAVAAWHQGRSHEARENWRKARALLDSDQQQDHSRINATTSDIINTLYHEGNLEGVEKELSSFINLPRYLQEELILDEDNFQKLAKVIVHTFVSRGKRSNAVDFLQQFISAIQTLTPDDQDLSYDLLRYLAQVSWAWELYELSEAILRSMLILLRQTEGYSLRAEAFLWEAIGSSLCLQTSQKRQDPYECYQAFIRICDEVAETDQDDQANSDNEDEVSWERQQLGLARACEVTGKPEKAAEIYEDVSASCEETMCSIHCIRQWYALILEARACSLKGKLVDALIIFFGFNPNHRNRSLCRCWLTDYDDCIMFIYRQLHIADLLDRCGCKASAINSRKEALSELRRRFFEPFESPEWPRERGLSQLLLAWSASTLHNILAIIDGKDPGDSNFACQQFPFEISWRLWNQSDDDFLFQSVHLD